MDGRPHTAYIASNVGDRAAKASSARRLMVRSGWSSGTRVSMSMNASMLTCGSCSPRIPTTSLQDGSTVSGAPISPEEPQTTKVGFFISLLDVAVEVKLRRFRKAREPQDIVF